MTQTLVLGQAPSALLKKAVNPKRVRGFFDVPFPDPAAGVLHFRFDKWVSNVSVFF